MTAHVAILHRRYINAILGGMGVAGGRAVLAMVPGVAAGLLVAAAWWPAVVG